MLATRGKMPNEWRTRCRKRGFVTITRDENDARALRIAQTPKCIEYFVPGVKELEFLEEIFNGFDAELTISFTRVYRSLKKMLPG